MPPNRAYYAAMHGAWRGRYRLDLTGRVTAASRLDAMAWRGFAWLLRLFPAFLETSVDASGTDVLHTTTLRVLGIALMKSVERIELDEDGHRLTLRGTQRFLMEPWRPREVSGTGAIAHDVSGASYALAFLGVALEQRVERVDDGTLRFTHVTPFARGDFLLRGSHGGDPGRSRPSLR